MEGLTSPYNLATTATFMEGFVQIDGDGELVAADPALHRSSSPDCATDCDVTTTTVDHDGVDDESPRGKTRAFVAAPLTGTRPAPLPGAQYHSSTRRLVLLRHVRHSHS